MCNHLFITFGLFFDVCSVSGCHCRPLHACVPIRPCRYPNQRGCVVLVNVRPTPRHCRNNNGGHWCGGNQHVLIEQIRYESSCCERVLHTQFTPRVLFVVTETVAALQIAHDFSGVFLFFFQLQQPVSLSFCLPVYYICIPFYGFSLCLWSSLFVVRPHIYDIVEG